MADELLTVTQVKKIFHFTDTMIKHLTPAQTYKRIGQKYPIKLYKLSDVLEFRESPLGMALMAAAEQRRQRFWEGIKRTMTQIDLADLSSDRVIDIDKLINKHSKEKNNERKQDADET